MQPSPGGSSSSTGGVGGGEVSRGGLSRFRSAPATWLEALLEEEEEDPLKPNQCLTQLLTSNSTTPTARNSVPLPNSADPTGLFEPTGFHRQNSSPADFLGNDSAAASDAYFSNFGVPANYDYLSPSIDVSPSSKRARELDTQYPPTKFQSQMKGEQSGQISSGISNLIDADMEKLLEDSVPCRVRAKRGCATHPRSIAERVRRTRISDRIRKLQELVPNMDKQTNTADMLEEAVEYVKYLQRQIQISDICYFLIAEGQHIRYCVWCQRLQCHCELYREDRRNIKIVDRNYDGREFAKMVIYTKTLSKSDARARLRLLY